MRPLFNHFDLLAPRYDRLFVRPADDPLPALVAAPPGSAIIDIGGGTGRNALLFQGAGCRTVVIDSSPEMLRRAKERGLDVVYADVTRLPFADEVFDRALMVDALHHFVAPSPKVAQPRAVSQSLRVLKSEGRLVLEEPNASHWQARLVAAIEFLLLMGSRFLEPDRLVHLFESEGARCVQREEHGFSVELVFRKASDAEQSGGAVEAGAAMTPRI
jgi:SAM-dependent methyltransferase